MSYLSEAIAVPYDMIGSEHSQFDLPLFILIRMRIGYDGYMLTNLNQLMQRLGYHSKNYTQCTKYGNEIKTSLMKLCEAGYLSGFCDVDEITPINLDDLTLSQYFIIKTDLYEWTFSREERYVILLIDDYLKLMHINTIPLWKILAVYCYLRSKIIKRPLSFDTLSEEEQCEMVNKRPEYVICCITDIAGDISAHISERTVSRIIKLLCELQIFTRMIVRTKNTDGKIIVHGTLLVPCGKWQDLDMKIAHEKVLNKERR